MFIYNKIKSRRLLGFVQKKVVDTSDNIFKNLYFIIYYDKVYLENLLAIILFKFDVFIMNNVNDFSYLVNCYNSSFKKFGKRNS